MEENYEGDYWIGLSTSPAPGFYCSNEAQLNESLKRIEKELRAAPERVLKLK